MRPRCCTRLVHSRSPLWVPALTCASVPHGPRGASTAAHGATSAEPFSLRGRTARTGAPRTVQPPPLSRAARRAPPQPSGDSPPPGKGTVRAPPLTQPARHGRHGGGFGSLAHPPRPPANASGTNTPGRRHAARSHTQTPSVARAAGGVPEHCPPVPARDAGAWLRCAGGSPTVREAVTRRGRRSCNGYSRRAWTGSTRTRGFGNGGGGSARRRLAPPRPTPPPA